MLDFVLLSPLIYSGEHIKHEKTTSLQCKTLEVIRGDIMRFPPSSQIPTSSEDVKMRGRRS